MKIQASKLYDVTMPTEVEFGGPVCIVSRTSNVLKARFVDILSDNDTIEFAKKGRNWYYVPVGNDAFPASRVKFTPMVPSGVKKDTKKMA